MARKCKCKICKSSLTTDIAYKVVNNRNQNEYYCNQEEYEERRKEIEYRTMFSLKLDEIFGGEPIINNYKWTLYKQMNMYTNEEIYNCLLVNKKNIEWALSEKLRDASETNQLQYVFAILNNSIKDTSKVYRKNKRPDVVVIDDFYIEEENEDVDSVFRATREGLMGKIKGIL